MKGLSENNQPLLDYWGFSLWVLDIGYAKLVTHIDSERLLVGIS